MVAVLKSIGAPTRAEFHEVIATRADRWYAACLRITRDRDLAEDAVQDATWIHRIAVNSALQILRKRRPGTWEPLEADIPDDTSTPDIARADEELGAGLTAALQQRALARSNRPCFAR